MASKKPDETIPTMTLVESSINQKVDGKKSVRVKVRSFIHNTIFEPGDIVHGYEGVVGENLEEVSVE